ncbi:hypothetical protein TPHA_0J00720 [Tetrapisispora phaffii CBS 4417]|uniref:Structural maintenance of chromosomes protein n=1 Tax=Tetrapisispora phaffii (strain ATCC 24235 / CBS 4417 / NBRC 1672 / NRRL Y-8282 / UCD 70-5) TaxID=1071381 RepID=G8BYF3_TETPH|nr:hypothetical protein TPHA_0J00720 [Tetrapisispora phaffii CBS 4417]CCE64895.1 hypothetical protein TPHA_0J00720 [Tetrapisispora phaffii CBS 4417]
MSALPDAKKQKVKDIESNSPLNNDIPKIAQSRNDSPLQVANDPLKSYTPMKVIISNNHSNSISPLPSQLMSSSTQPPSLQHPSSSSRGRAVKAYSQSPPRSPDRSPVRSPTRKLELIQLSPIKNSRSELQKIYSSKQEEKIERICLNKLVLHNFKSYAGTQTIGPFHSSFSAVVGPNGSGKSNVIDSMLFVFGFRANKMRQGKLADLIHKSEEYPDLTSCAVDVHFEYLIDYPDDTTKINPSKQPLIITRRAFKNSTSKYYLNGKESNYKTITALLKEEGIDLDHNRFLILQGEVENIAQMKPKAEKEGDDGLLEYLEDIIGTTKYKELIDKKFIEIEALNDICIERENRFDIIDREKESLESEKESALEYLSKEKEQVIVKSKLIQYKIWQNNIKLSNTLEKITKLEDEYNQEKNKNTELKNKIDELRKLYTKNQDELQALLKDEKELVNAKRSLDSDNVSNTEQLKNIEKKLKKTAKEIEEDLKTISSSNVRLKNFHDNKKLFETQLIELDNNLVTESQLLENIKLDLKDKTVGLSEEILKTEKDLEPWNIKLDELKSEIQIKESEKALFEESKNKLKANIEALEKDVNEKSKLTEDRRKEVKNLMTKLENVSKEVIFGTNELKKANEKLCEMQKILIQDRQKANDARTSLSNVENRSKVLRALLKLQKSGRINGFHGRLGNLGVIDEKYDVAISTACPRLNDIVVDSVECGQQCIEYLRKNNLGHARFILLDKLNKFSMEKISTPRNVPRLFDLIKVNDEKFLPAFYSVLRNTLVANDLKEANAVAYGKTRYRVVTLKGNLIDISGTMSGGGNQASKGAMQLSNSTSKEKSTYSSEEVMEIEKELSIREKNYQNAYNTVQEMEIELRNLKESEPKIELEISKLNFEIDSLENECSLKRKQLNEPNASFSIEDNMSADITEMDNALYTLNEKQKLIESQMKSKKDRIKELQDKIMKIGGIKLQMQNSKVDSLQEQKKILIKKQKSEKAGIMKIESDVRKLSKKLKESESDNTKLNEKKIALENELKNIEELLAQNENNMNCIQDKKFTLREKSEITMNELTEMEGLLSEFKTLEVEYKIKSEKLASLLNQIKKILKALEEDHSSLSIREVAYDLDLLNIKEQEAQKIKTELYADFEQNQSNDVINDEMIIEDNNNEIAKGIPSYMESDFKQFDISSLEAELVQLQDYFEIAKVDLDILEEYTRRMIEYRQRKYDLNQSVEQRDKVRKELEDLKKCRFNEFMESFNIISMTLKEMYQIITMGGNAELELVDSLDPFSEGVTFSVMPPKKSWRNISNLSGGEKTLSSLALVFALHKYKPTPLYVMDEIDAALDFRNVSIVANYIKERTKNAQFIVISLRNNMFELAEQLVGIYKNVNQTKSATLKNNDILCRK